MTVALDPATNVPGNHQHEGTCVNAIWFDNHDGTIIICAHPEGDVSKAPSFERTLSVSAFADIVTALGV